MSRNRKCCGVAQLPWLIFHILNLPHFSSFQVFCLHVKVNNNSLSTFHTGKIHENFQYLFNEIRGQFQNFPPRRRGPGRGLGGLYSIECPRIGGKKTISLKRFFSPTRAPAGPPQNLFYPLAFTWGPSIHAYKGENRTKKKNLSTSTSSVNGDEKKSFRKYIPLFGVFLNIYPCFERIRSSCVCVRVRTYA